MQIHNNYQVMGLRECFEQPKEAVENRRMQTIFERFCEVEQNPVETLLSKERVSLELPPLPRGLG